MADAMSVQKLHGRAFYESIGSPKKILAPMVDQSELPWRLLSLRHGADICYSPMIHAKLFSSDPKYRKKIFSTCSSDRPLIVQFCANDPEILLSAAQFMTESCVAVDINFGCPQGIARKGNYGAFLQDKWDIVESLVKTLHTKLPIPVTAKIRVFDEREKTLEYAQRIINAGASILTVHGRTRDQKGQLTGLADWKQIRYLRDNLPPETVIFANGNILNYPDIEACLATTGADGVMSAEGSLYNPRIFLNPKEHGWEQSHPRLDHLMREYIDVIRENGLDDDASSVSAVKGHLFKILRPLFAIHTDLRNRLGSTNTRSFDELESYYDAIRQRIEEAVRSGELCESTDVPGETDAQSNYEAVPWWRAQCHLRPPPKITPKRGALPASGIDTGKTAEQGSEGDKRRRVGSEEKERNTDMAEPPSTDTRERRVLDELEIQRENPIPKQPEQQIST